MTRIPFPATRLAALRAGLGGWTARRAGLPSTECPYRNHVAGAEAFLAHCWHMGWQRGPDLADPAMLSAALRAVCGQIAAAGAVVVDASIEATTVPRVTAVHAGQRVSVFVVAIDDRWTGADLSFPVLIDAMSNAERAALISPVAFVLLDRRTPTTIVDDVLPWGAVIRMARAHRERLLAGALDAADVARLDAAPIWLPKTLLDELTRPWEAALAGQWA